MPSSLDIESSITCADFYHKYTKNAVEIHYALIDGVNDTIEDALRLSRLIQGKGFNVKFLFYNKKESIDYHASNTDKLKTFKAHLDDSFIPFEYYVPPGLSIGASCGSFLMDFDVYDKDI
jgi:23S rRNA (adenine2503-C2)-methyltransferase